MQYTSTAAVLVLLDQVYSGAQQEVLVQISVWPLGTSEPFCTTSRRAQTATACRASGSGGGRGGDERHVRGPDVQRELRDQRALPAGNRRVFLLALRAADRRLEGQQLRVRVVRQEDMMHAQRSLATRKSSPACARCCWLSGLESTLLLKVIRIALSRLVESTS